MGQPLDERKSGFLVICSFLLPILVWCFIAYNPFLWKVDYRITLTGVSDDKEAFGATYIEGDTMEENYFAEFQESIRKDNLTLGQASTGTPAPSPRSIRRINKKLLRDFEPILVANGWFDSSLKDQTDTKDYYLQLYSASYAAWERIANDPDTLKKGTLSPENITIVQKNWASLESISPIYDSNNFYSQPLLKLIPEGEKKIGRPSYIPAPHEVIFTAWNDFRGKSELGDLSVWSKYGESLRVVFTGFFISCLIGVPLALIAGTFPFFSRLLEPFADFFRYMPAPAFSTVLIAVFGLAHSPKIALIVLGTLPHLILMAANTTRMVDRSLLDAAQTLGATNQKLVSRVVIPAILPSLYDDLRILLGWAWTWLVIAELIGAKSGLTEIIDTQGRRFHFDHVYPIIFLIGITGFLTDQILSAIRTIIFPWTADGKIGIIGKFILLPKRLTDWLLSDRSSPSISTSNS